MGRTRGRLRLAAIVLVSFAVVVGVVGYFGIPAAARWGIETVASREIGRTVRVEEIRANPYTLRVTITGLTVEGQPGETAPLLTVQRTTVNASITSVLRLAPIVDAISIDGLNANIVRLEAQRFNFDDIIERLRAKPKTDDEPARFALNNIEVANSSIQFDDRVGNRKHAVTEMAIGIPFISNLPVDSEVKVLPAFSARINGSPLELKGETRPFHETLESSLDLKISGLDIAKYLSFAPVRLNFNVENGTLDTDLRIAFRRALTASAEQKGQPAQTLISGSIGVNEFALSEKSPNARLLNWKALRVTLDQFEPFARRAAIGDIRLDGLNALVARNAAGELNWTRFASQAIGSAPAPGKPSSDSTGKAAAPPFAFTLKHASLNGGHFDLADETVSFQQQLVNVTAEASALSNAPNARGTVRVAAELKDLGSVSLDGELGITPIAGRLKYAAKDVKLQAAARYLAHLVDAKIDGSSNVNGVLEIASGGSGVQPALRELAVVGTGITVRGPAAQGATLDIATFAIEGGDIDLTRRAMTFAKVSLDAPRVMVRRLADGTINWAQVIKRPADGVRATAQAPQPSPWSIAVSEAEIARGDVQFEDRAVEPAVKLRASAIAGSVRNIIGDGSAPAEFALRTRLGSGGTLAANGNARWDTPSANVRIDARNLDVATLRPYLAPQLNGDLASAEVSGRGTLLVSKAKQDAALRASYNGSVRLTNVHALDSGSNDVLRWQALDIDKVAVKIGDAPPAVDLGKITLNDFFARVIVSEQGRLNLLDLIKRDPAQVRAADSAQQTAGAAAPARPTIRIANIELARGNVTFTDNFVKPNFTANMTGLGGTVTTLASDSTEPATMALTGKIDDEAPLQIGGRLNPLAPTVFLDIEGSTKGVDLPRLTSYSVKYAGYPIVKGKLSMDVKYKIDDQKLAASNRVFLDQLTFGERVDSPTATKLPVLLAVSLLKNSRGEIDINLPISGTLDDPQFSIGGLIVQVIINVLTKIVTAPFSLLAAAFGGGGEELGYVEFAPGAAALTEAQTQRLQTLAKALNDRPSLRLDIIGRVEPAADTDGILRAKYDAKLRAVKVRQLVRSGGESVDPAKAAITDSERPALIAAVYSEEKIPDKPRNFVGMAKTLPAAEMEALIRANLAVTPEDLRALANQRASAVRNALETEGKVPRERMFLVEPKLTAEGIKDQGAKSRVDFSLK